MKYKYCPECKGMNRDTDATCYQCGKAFAEMLAQTAEAAPVGSYRGAGGGGKPEAELDIGAVLSQSLQLYIKTLPRLAALTAIMGAVAVVTFVVSIFAAIQLHPLVFLLSTPVWCLLTPVFWSSHMRLLLAAQRDEDLPLPQCLSIGLMRGISLFLTMLVIGVLAIGGLIVAMFLSLGLIWLILPVVVLVCTVFWFLFVPCSVLEDHLFFSGFSRSAELVRPHLAKVALLALLAWVIGFAASSLPGLVGNAAVGTITQLAMQAQMAAHSAPGGASMPGLAAAPSGAALLGTLVGAMIPISLCFFLSILGGAFSLVVPFVVYWNLTKGRCLSGGI